MNLPLLILLLGLIYIVLFGGMAFFRREGLSLRFALEAACIQLDPLNGAALARDIAMHIAASKPKSLDASGVSQDLIDMERRVAIEKAKEAGKPEAMLEKIAEGTVQKFLKEVTLLSQPFVKDDKQTVEQVLKSKNSQCHGFMMYVVGEGIEKKVSDFAAEVAAASKV